MIIETWFSQDIQKPVQVQHIDGNLFSHNGNGNRIGVELTNGVEPYTVSGTVSGYVVLSDGTTVPCVGSHSGSRASILIPPAAYLPGNIFITVFVTDGTTVTTIAAVSSTVVLARTDTQVDPGSVITDWTNTINAAMQEVETAAEDLGGIIAVPYASITYPVPLGKYTYYNGDLYRCISPIASSETFTPAHWTAVRLGDDVADIKNAFDETNYNIKNGSSYWYQGVPTGASDHYVSTKDSIDSIARIYPPSGMIVFLYAQGVGYYKTDGTFVDRASNASYWGTEGVNTIQIQSEYPAYTWYAVVQFASGSITIPADAQNVLLVESRTFSANIDIAEIKGTLDYEKSNNLFNKDTISIGKYIGAKGALIDDPIMFYELVPIPSPGTYSFLVSRKYFGNNASTIRMFNDSDVYVDKITATLDSQDNTDMVIAHITVSNQYYSAGCKKIGITNKIYVASMMMVVEGDTYPSTYIPFIDGVTIPSLYNNDVLSSEKNTLYLKQVVFDGDSICNGNSEGGSKLAWAGRVGIADNMRWINEGVSGATITPGLGASKSILTDFETIHTNYPDLDYYIFDGGVNDADRNATLGTYDPNDYSGSYDTSTFSGAFETLLFKAVSYYPNAKIGYIVAQKMYWNNNIPAYEKRKQYFDRAIALCEKWGVPYVNLWDNSTLNPFLAAHYDPSKSEQGNIDAGKLYVDGQHLAPNGYNLVWNKIGEWMESL